MKAILIAAHGSRRQASNEEVTTLTQNLGESIQQAGYDFIHCAFLELAQPSIPDGIRECIAKGAKEVIIMPYFLSAGRHVAQDIPHEVDSVRSEFPDVVMHIAPYLGQADGLKQIILGQVALV